MKHDLYGDLASLSACPTSGPLPSGLVSGFVDGCTAWSTRGGDAKNAARKCYMKRAEAADLFPQELADLLDPVPPALQPGWLSIEVSFTLQSPWYSKDDRPFHVLDNPVRKDRVFGVPFMSAASWKGLLRWSCRMVAGLLQHLERHGGKLDGWQDPSWIVHLFGNEKGATDDLQRGALAFYPTWFQQIGFEVINPHSRKTRAGTQPVYYEVVPPGTHGRLHLLYAPLPSQAAKDGVEPNEALGKLLDAAEKLLMAYGFSARRTAGWGMAKVDEWVLRGQEGEERGTREQVTAALGRLLHVKEATP